ncbi:hypothetical protein PQR33_36090 [Paraburkholderia sediminicola]|uniref:hypothetical protein n=1 Tax=Paraburkholderia sediminicola TaxID=458836 RepID=UPI0038BDAF0B
MPTGRQGLIAALFVLTPLAMSGCANDQVGSAHTPITRVFVPPVQRGGGTSNADTNVLMAAFRSAGFSPVALPDMHSPLPDSNAAIYVAARAGGDEYCLEALVRGENLKSAGEKTSFEWRQQGTAGGAQLSRENCATAFVSGLRGELSKRKL